MIYGHSAKRASFKTESSIAMIHTHDNRNFSDGTMNAVSLFVICIYTQVWHFEMSRHPQLAAPVKPGDRNATPRLMSQILSKQCKSRRWTRPVCCHEWVSRVDTLPGHDADGSLAISSLFPAVDLDQQIHQRRELPLHAATLVILVWRRRPALHLEHPHVLGRRLLVAAASRQSL